MSQHTHHLVGPTISGVLPHGGAMTGADGVIIDTELRLQIAPVDTGLISYDPLKYLWASQPDIVEFMVQGCTIYACPPMNKLRGPMRTA